MASTVWFGRKLNFNNHREFDDWEPLRRERRPRLRMVGQRRRIQGFRAVETEDSPDAVADYE
jgi:hypothetical protein